MLWVPATKGRHEQVPGNAGFASRPSADSKPADRPGDGERDCLSQAKPTPAGPSGRERVSQSPTSSRPSVGKCDGVGCSWPWWIGNPLYSSARRSRNQRSAVASTGPAAAATHLRGRWRESNTFGRSNVLRLVLRTQPRTGEFARPATLSEDTDRLEHSNQLRGRVSSAALPFRLIAVALWARAACCVPEAKARPGCPVWEWDSQELQYTGVWAVSGRRATFCSPHARQQIQGWRPRCDMCRENR